MEEDKRLKFKKIYMNLPEKIRLEDIIVVLDGKPFNWNAAYFEVNNNTITGKKILDKLVEMKLL